ncbi:MAG: hypothetical protein KDC66_19260 [Phaeodactylibacter sp.]|nr:hypothetical protein [Phaeodactylibacter sp.]MCB9273796.1 hypothetical protein [Lewinellaceae bacterium]
MIYRSLLLAIAALFAFSFPANAQAIRNATERTADHKQIAQGKHQLERDRQELADFNAKVATFNEALAARELGRARDIHADLASDMRREIEQSKAKLYQDNKEVAASRSEVRSDRREIQRDRRDFATSRNANDDVRDIKRDRVNKMDDKHDKRDDIRDREAQQARLNRQEVILRTIEAYSFSDASVFEKAVANQHLIQEFADTMAADIAATEQELKEDHRELREDRREGRDDRRERREGGN